MSTKKFQISRRTLLAGAALGAGTTALSIKTPLIAAQPPPRIIASKYGPPSGVAKLNANENPYGPSPTAIKAMSEAIQKGAYYANASVTKLKSMIAERNGVSTDHIMITSGSSGALMYLAAAVSQSGHIIGPDLFWDTTSKMGTRNSPFGLKYLPKTEDLSIDLKKMYQSINSETALVQVTNPNNPTGMLLDADELSDFSKKASKKTMVLIDEAYNELTDDPVKNSMLPLIKQGENVVIARTFSKIYGLAGMRVGYMIAKPETIEMASAFGLGDYSLNLAGVAGAIACYNDSDFLDYSKSKIVEAKQMIMEALDQEGLNSLPSQTNFMFINLKDLNAEKFRAAMADQGVLIRGIYRDYNNWSRVSMGTLEDVQKFVDTLPRAIELVA